MISKNSVLDIINNKELITELAMQRIIYINSTNLGDDYDCVTIDIEHLLEIENTPHIFDDKNFLIELQQKLRN